MANISANDITKWRIMPIHHVRLGVNSGGDYYFNIIEGSSFKFAPIIRVSDSGQDRVVAIKFDGTFVFAQNDLPTLQTGMSNINGYEVLDFDIFLKPGWSASFNESMEFDSQTHSASGQISVDAISTQPFVKKWSASWSLDQNSDSPRVTIFVKGLFSIDIFSKCNLFSITNYTD